MELKSYEIGKDGKLIPQNDEPVPPSPRGKPPNAKSPPSPRAKPIGKVVTPRKGNINEAPPEMAASMKSNSPGTTAQHSRGSSVPHKLTTEQLEAQFAKEDKRMQQWACLFIFIYIFGGSSVYYWLEGWGYTESLYFAVTTLTTVGYGDLYPVTDGGKVFTMFYIVVALTIVISALTLLVEFMFHHLASASAVDLVGGDDNNDDASTGDSPLQTYLSEEESDEAALQSRL